MTGEALWASILQEAISGRLVPQIDSEPEVEQIGEAPKEVPFEIPKKWKWIKLINISSYLKRGKSPKYSLEKKIPVISQKCNHWDLFLLENAKFIEEESLKSYNNDALLQDNDILINSTGLGTIGRACIYKTNINKYGIAVADSHVTIIRFLTNKVLHEYFYYFWMSNFVQDRIEEVAVGSTKQKELNISVLNNYLVPLPPLAEQQRIVDRLNELKPLVDEYGKANKELVEIEAAFPEKLKASLIQEAIQGKLVPQLDSEPEVEQIGEAPKEVPFEIPKKWKFVYLKHLVKIITGTSYNKSDIQNIGVRIIRGGNIKNFTISLFDDDVFVNERLFNNTKVVKQNDIVIVASTGSSDVIGNPGEYLGDKKIQIGAFLRIIRPIFNDYSNYIKVIFRSDYYRKYIKTLSRGTNIKNVKGEYIYYLPIPLPPLAEQQRIVDRLNELKLLVDEYGKANKELAYM